jgi:hypothetical protein
MLMQEWVADWLLVLLARELLLEWFAEVMMANWRHSVTLFHSEIWCGAIS